MQKDSVGSRIFLFFIFVVLVLIAKKLGAIDTTGSAIFVATGIITMAFSVVAE